MKNQQDYNLTAKQAAQTLGKSRTTIHRYIKKGKLSARYVNTDHGKEVRLKKGEVQRLAEGLNNRVIPDGKEELFTGKDKSGLEVSKLLERYERSLYQLGQLTERLENQKEKREDRINRLEEKEQRLKSHLHDKAALIEALQDELSRPLTLKERLSGRRSSNH